MSRVKETPRSEAETFRRDASFQDGLKEEGKCLFSKELGKLEEQKLAHKCERDGGRTLHDRSPHGH